MTDHTDEAKADRPDLAPLLLASIGEEPFNEIIETAKKDGTLEGDALLRSIATSGAVIGIEHLQERVNLIAKAPMDAMKRILDTIDARLPSAAGDDEMTAFIAELRAPVVELIAEHIGTAQQGVARGLQDLFGVSSQLIMAQIRPEPIPEAEMDTIAMTITLNTNVPFWGFVLHPDVAGMKCPCTGCLASHYMNNRRPSEEVNKLAIEKFGSAMGAMRAYATHMLAKAGKDLRELETSFGNLDSPNMDHVIPQATDLFSRLQRGGTTED